MRIEGEGEGEGEGERSIYHGFQIAQSLPGHLLSGGLEIVERGFGDKGGIGGKTVALKLVDEVAHISCYVLVMHSFPHFSFFTHPHKER